MYESSASNYLTITTRRSHFVIYLTSQNRSSLIDRMKFKKRGIPFYVVLKIDHSFLR